MTISAIFINSANAIYVHRYQQEQSKWCWAASAQMMGHTMGRDVTQSAIVDYVLGTVANVSSGDIENEKKAVNYATLRNTTLRRSALSFAASKSELDVSANTLTVVDPWTGCGTKAFSYNSMITGCDFQSGSGKWSNSITI